MCQDCNRRVAQIGKDGNRAEKMVQMRNGSPWLQRSETYFSESCEALPKVHLHRVLASVTHIIGLSRCEIDEIDRRAVKPKWWIHGDSQESKQLSTYK